MLIVDDICLSKQGTPRGGSRQYSGALGKMDNGQVTVNLTYAERTLAYPLLTRLSLPPAWTADPARRAKSHIPAELVFQTTAEFGIELIDCAIAQS